MLKKILLLLPLLLCLLLSSCASANKYGLSLAPDGKDNPDYIYRDDDTVVYVVGGIMTVKLDKTTYSLEQALAEDKITVSDILSSAKEDAEKERISSVTYPDGSVEYNYDGFNLVVLNSGIGGIYFLPDRLNYYSIAN